MPNTQNGNFLKNKAKKKKKKIQGEKTQLNSLNQFLAFLNYTSQFELQNVVRGSITEEMGEKEDSFFNGNTIQRLNYKSMTNAMRVMTSLGH